MDSEDTRAPIMAVYWLGGGLLVAAALLAALNWHELVAEALAILGH